MPESLSAIAQALVTDGKGVLAADETPGTLTRRFEQYGIASTPDTRRAYREMLFSAPGLGQWIGGVILQDETIRQTTSQDIPFADLLAERGMLPGIKVDLGAKPLAGSDGETVTEGLDGLRERLAEYRTLGARFTKWRAVIRIDGQRLPSWSCMHANAHALARYAALAQEQGLAPIVEPEVLMDGAHSLAECEAVTNRMLWEVFTALVAEHVLPEGILLKPSMILPGGDGGGQASVEDVAKATLQCLLHNVPAAVPGIAFLSGGQSANLATAHLDAINRLPGIRPWPISFSFGRALQDPALQAWAGKQERAGDGARALIHRARCNAAAAIGAYDPTMEEAAPEPALLDR
ncbi:fructose-bisphosphate aldolase class I [Novosphingobium sp. G106]|uniref:class I fructose-bisphosphate aldolase n=1 Tax=Novosphingobium sp. G106 TaxID=2849500 RepID=UPI001C2D3A30|nr:class I fructose-bisphosphate aldolase [Novosphingobium sp. G106]MBV1688831.1 fructose-bisphosphate aldolase class I [Novosphingobium sp. G106]